MNKKIKDTTFHYIDFVHFDDFDHINNLRIRLSKLDIKKHLDHKSELAKPKHKGRNTVETLILSFRSPIVINIPKSNGY
jgi:hypothetical protein